MDTVRMEPLRRWLQRHRRQVALAVALVGGLSTATTIGWQQHQLHDLGEPRPIVVTTHPMAAGALLRRSDLVRRDVPFLYVPVGAIERLEAVVGQLTLGPMESGEVVTRSRVISVEAAGRLSPRIAAGERAITIGVDHVQGLAGWVRAGDRVDLLASFDFGAREGRQAYVFTVLQGVAVLAVGGDGAKSASAQRTVTLAVTPDAAQRVLFAQANGRLHLVLQPLDADPHTVRLSPATAATVTGMDGLIQRKEYRGR